MQGANFDAVRMGADQLFSHPTWDVILVFTLIAAAFFYGISAGKRKISLSIIYTYVAYALFSALPVGKFAGMAGEGQEYLVKVLGFLALVIVLVLLVGGRRRRSTFAPASSWWKVFLLSVLEVGLLAHILLGFLPKEEIAALAPLTKNFFANPNYRIWWFLIPLAVVVFLQRLDSREE